MIIKKTLGIDGSHCHKVSVMSVASCSLAKREHSQLFLCAVQACCQRASSKQTFFWETLGGGGNLMNFFFICWKLHCTFCWSISCCCSAQHRRCWICICSFISFWSSKDGAGPWVLPWSEHAMNSNRKPVAEVQTEVALRCNTAATWHSPYMLWLLAELHSPGPALHACHGLHDTHGERAQPARQVGKCRARLLLCPRTSAAQP